MWREQVVHNDKVNLATARQLDPMETVEPRHERMRVVLDVRMVIFEDRPEVLVFGVVNGLDDEAVVSRKVEEGSRLSWRSEFGQDVFRRQGQQIVGRIQVKVIFPQFSKDPRRIILELEVVTS
jgi:hypothetical protein